jgi:hypothetical protein
MLNSKNCSLNIIVLLFLLISFNTVFSQEDDFTSANFLGITGGINLTQMNSSGTIFDEANFEPGYYIGLSYNIFPDYGYSSSYLRFAIGYSKEQSSTRQTVLIQDEFVSTTAKMDLAEIHLLYAYRFNPEATVDTYLGGGLQLAFLTNNTDEAFTIENENGSIIPIFEPDTATRPVRFRTEAPTINFGPFAEFGFFVPVAKNHLGLATGISYTFYVSNASSELQFGKTNAYLRATYQLF